MSTSEKIEKLITYSRILYERKLLHATGGNTSVRDGEAVWISQTGAELGFRTEYQVVKVDLQGMHLAMYRARPAASAVIHAHPTFCITHSALVKEETNNAIPPYTAAFYVRAGRVPMIPYHPSGAHSLHVAVEELAADYHALLLRQHGMIVAGANMAETLGMIEEIEQCCQISIASGMKGEWLTEAQCEQIDQALGRSWKV